MITSMILASSALSPSSNLSRSRTTSFNGSMALSFRRGNGPHHQSANSADGTTTLELHEVRMSRITAVEQGRGTSEQEAAYNDEIARVGQVTNMKKAILH